MFTCGWKNILKPSLLAATFAAILLSGCTSATLDAEGDAGPGFSYAGGTASDLPDTMAIPASSFARATATQDGAMAALASQAGLEM